MSSRLVKLVAFVRHRPVVTTCFALALLLGLLNPLLWRQRAELTALDEEARRKGEFMLHALSSRGRIDSDLVALREAMAQIEGNLLDEQSMEVNLGYFYRFEKQTRVRLNRLHQLAPLPAPPGTRYKAVPFSMQVVGPYANNIRFLRALETGPRILRVRHCNFERTDNPADLLMEITVDVLAKSS